RRAPRAPHRRLPALPRHRRQQHLLARARRGRRLRGARRLARRPRRRAVPPLHPAPGRAAAAGGDADRGGGRAPRAARLARRARAHGLRAADGGAAGVSATKLEPPAAGAAPAAKDPPRVVEIVVSVPTVAKALGIFFGVLLVYLA